MSIENPRDIIDVKAQQFWVYSVTLDGKRPENSAKTIDCLDYEETKKRCTKNSRTWIRSVKIQTSDWEQVPPGENIDLPPMFDSIHISQPERFIEREIQYNYLYLQPGYTIENAPKEEIVLRYNYQDASSLTLEYGGTIHIRQVTIDFEPWLEIHPSEHPNPPVAPTNIAAL